MAISRIETNSIAPSQTLTTPIVATTMGVGGATPAASGSGITFPAAQSASTDVNTLDDYEEGTWSPNVGGSATYSSQQGSYTKVGRLVTVTIDMTISSIGTGSGWSIQGLPFASISTYFGCGSVGYYTSTALSMVWLSMYVNPGAATLNITGNTSAATGIQQNAGPNAIFQTGTRIICSATYQTT